MKSSKKRNWHIERVKDEKVRSYLSYVLTYQNEQFSWYEDKKGKRRTFSTWLLNLALVAFSLSLIFPLFPGIINDNNGNYYAAGYISLIITTIILLGDRLFGHSNGWIRYTLAYLQIDRVTSEFHNKWLILLPKLNDEAMPRETKTAALELLQKFDIALKNVVKDETENWRNFFTNQLSEFYRKAESKLASTEQDILEFQSETKQKLRSFDPVHLKIELSNIPESSSVDTILKLSENTLLQKIFLPNDQTWVIMGCPKGSYLFEGKVNFNKNIPPQNFQDIINVSGESQIQIFKKEVTNTNINQNNIL
ncbi:MAG: SLATT domain-containing protein [Bacteroidota bacterium]